MFQFTEILQNPRLKLCQEEVIFLDYNKLSDTERNICKKACLTGITAKEIEKRHKKSPFVPFFITKNERSEEKCCTNDLWNAHHPPVNAILLNADRDQRDAERDARVDIGPLWICPSRRSGERTNARRTVLQLAFFVHCFR